jgi:hypothetical protein
LVGAPAFPSAPDARPPLAKRVAHVVGLFLFQSVRYQRIFSDFFQAQLIGPPIAVVISAVLVLVI